ncbi:Stf0 sulfotransferase family protein [Streptomyces sp. AD2-2]|nr:Stf0 sulfotransferase family protein [Streptomyces sp. AD2-2]
MGRALGERTYAPRSPGLRRVRTGRTDGQPDGDGVFGAKLMWGSHTELADRLGELHPELAGDELRLLEREFGQPIRFDRDALTRVLRTTEAHNTGWDHWFESYGIHPHRVRCEVPAADPRAVTRDALAHLGLALPDGHPRPPPAISARRIASTRSGPPGIARSRGPSPHRPRPVPCPRPRRRTHPHPHA